MRHLLLKQPGFPFKLVQNSFLLALALGHKNQLAGLRIPGKILIRPVSIQLTAITLMYQLKAVLGNPV